MRILVFAFQLNPHKGSECAVAWDYITEMSKSHELHVIYGACEGFHDIGNTKYVEDYTLNHKYKNIIFIPFKPSFRTKNWQYNAIETYLFYREYTRYHKEVYSFARNYIKEYNIDIIHYLGPIGYHEPGYMWNLNIPYIWGPIGGFSNIKFKLLPATFSITGGLNLVVKSMLNLIQSFTSIRLRKALNQSAFVIASTTEARKRIRCLCPSANVSYLPENCIKELFPLNEDKFSNSIIRLIWIGRTDSQKGLPILLDALSLLKLKIVNMPIHVDIIGMGPLQTKMIDYAKKKNIDDCVVWHGQIDRTKVYELMNDAHINVITSLNEANTTVIWEAMSLGVPTIALDHCGMHDTVSSRNGIKIPVKSYKLTVRTLAEEIENLIFNPKILEDLAHGVLELRDNYTWDKRALKFEEVYREALDKSHFDNRK